MMNKRKYVVVNGSIIVFSQAISHDAFAHMKPTIAGFIGIHAGESEPNGIGLTNYELRFKCYGESHSLGLKSDEGDSELANRQLGNNY